MTRFTPWIIVLSVWAVAWPNLASSPPPNLDNTLEAQHERISRNPGDAVAWNDLGNLLVLADRFTEAEEAYRKALSLAPSDTAARFNLALLLHQQGRANDAAKELEELIAVEPRHAWGHYQLGVILAARKDRSGALEHYARALAYDPTLTFAEHNPHIIENPLFSEALLRSQRYVESSATRVPRLYGEPDRIVELMLDFEMAKEAAEAGEAAGAEEVPEGEDGATPSGGGGANARFDTPPPVGQGRAGAPGTGAPSKSDQERLRTVVVGQAQGETDAASGRDPSGRDPSGRASARRLPPRSSAAPDPRGRARDFPPGAADPLAGDDPPPTGRLAPPPPTRSSRYLPGRRSTSQLDLKLLPEEEPPTRWASVDPGG